MAEIDYAQWMTTAQAAHMLGCTVNNIQRHIERGNLEAHKVIDRWLVSRQSVEAYIANPPKRGRKPKRKQEANIE